MVSAGRSGHGRVNRVRMAHLNHFGGLWGLGAVLSGLVLGRAGIKANGGGPRAQEAVESVGSGFD